MYAAMATPIIPITFSLKEKPSVMVNSDAFNVAGAIPPTADRRKNSRTTPGGKIKPITSPKAEPIRAPKKRIRNKYPIDFLRVEATGTLVSFLLFLDVILLLF